MIKENKKYLKKAICFSAAFVLWTVLVSVADVREIGPLATSVGFGAVNSFVHNLTGVHTALYDVTDWLSLLPFALVFGFGLLGFIQWLKRGSITKVDYDILVLGGFYIVVIALYLLFETIVVNYRPVLINGELEASYPSSTTMLVLCVMPTAVMQFNSRIKNCIFKRFVSVGITAFTVFMVMGRLISGVHWFSDVVGGVLLSAGLTETYRFICNLKRKF